MNNERAEKNASYAINLASLENFVLVKHNQVICCLFIFMTMMIVQDSMVEPRESSHFEFYTPGQAEALQKDPQKLLSCQILSPLCPGVLLVVLSQAIHFL